MSFREINSAKMAMKADVQPVDVNGKGRITIEGSRERLRNRKLHKRGNFEANRLKYRRKGLTAIQVFTNY